MLKEIEKLNNEIDRLMTEKTKADAQKEVWENRLCESIIAYKNEYGVDLSGGSLDEIKTKLQDELEKVESKTKQEYNKAVTLINLINEGSIAEAWKIINGGNEVKEAPSVNEVNNISNPETVKPIVNVKESVVETPSADTVAPMVSDEDFYGEGTEEDSETVEVVGSEKSAPNNFINFGAFSMVEDDDDEELVINNKSPFTIEDDEDEEFIQHNNVEIPKVDESIIVPKKLSTNPSLSENVSNFGDFEGILKGTKFEN